MFSYSFNGKDINYFFTICEEWWGVGRDQYNKNGVERMTLTNKTLSIPLTASDGTEFRTQEETQMIKSQRQNCLWEVLISDLLLQRYLYLFFTKRSILI